MNAVLNLQMLENDEAEAPVNVAPDTDGSGYSTGC
jgi:hypothetical protein